MLGGRRRDLHSRPGTHLLGPTGARLWADYLTDAAGFVGAIDYIHKINIPLLFAVEPEAVGPTAANGAQSVLADPADVVWYPSHLQMTRRYGELLLQERKTISWDDRAVSEQQWTNAGSSPAVIGLRWDLEWCHRDGNVVRGSREIGRHGFTLCIVISPDLDEVLDGLVIPPGDTVGFTVEAALSTQDETRTAQSPTVETLFGDPPKIADCATDGLIADYQSWFDKTPTFRSSSAMLDRAWHYRWFLLRHNLARPRRGALRDWVMYEGRSHKMTKAPWRPTGWEFSKHIPLSTPFHLLELRWHHDQRFGNRILESLVDRQIADGQFCAATVTEVMKPYANFNGWAAWSFVEVSGENVPLVVLEALKRQVRGERDHLAGRADGLPVQREHQLTGKEYQPSFWYFNGGRYPESPKNSSAYVPLKRVDRAVYHYLNALGVGRLCERCGDPDAGEFQSLASEVRGSVERLCWDEEHQFYFDLHHQTDERAIVRNVVGFYPWWAGITPADRVDALVAALNDADGFKTSAPVPSVETRCPVYSPDGGWNGLYFKGPRGCVWDGPSWPYTNGIVLDAVGRATRQAGHRHDLLFARLLRSYVLMHFDSQDGRNPYLVEHYNPESGEPISDEVDYNHSYLIDLIIRYVAGLTIERQGIRVDPLQLGLSWFALEDVHVAGHTLSIMYDENGLRVDIDGRLRGFEPSGKGLAVGWE